jgi:predicted CXXCH cytochrome family protein
MFTGRYVHPPVEAGMCTGCHEPHQGDLEKLLLAGPPELCYNCHGKEMFEKENRHPPAAEGQCLICHNPHASQNPAMAILPVNEVCLGCHPGVLKGPHAAGTFSLRGHPLEGRADPKSRYGELSCASCHDPHSSAFPTLFRYPAQTAFELCVNCHPNAYGKGGK